MAGALMALMPPRACPHEEEGANVMRPRCRKDKNPPVQRMCCLKLSNDELSAKAQQEAQAAQVTRSQAGRSGRKKRSRAMLVYRALEAKESIDVAMSLGMDLEDQLRCSRVQELMRRAPWCRTSRQGGGSRSPSSGSSWRRRGRTTETEARTRSQDSRRRWGRKRLADQGIREDEEMDECLSDASLIWSSGDQEGGPGSHPRLGGERAQAA